MTVLFKSCLVYDCDFLTPRELSCFVALEMTQYVAPWRGLLGDSQLRKNLPARGELLSVRGFLRSDCQGIEGPCKLLSHLRKTPSLRSFPSSNRQGVEDPCTLRSKWFVRKDSVS